MDLLMSNLRASHTSAYAIWVLVCERRAQKTHIEHSQALREAGNSIVRFSVDVESSPHMKFLRRDFRY